MAGIASVCGPTLIPEAKVMNTALLRHVLLALLSISVSAGVHALPIANPNPSVLADDSGAERFVPDAYTVSFEIFDALDELGLDGTEFGFFYVADPTVKTVVFTDDDVGGEQFAFIDFIEGRVYDVDGRVDPAASNLESTFSVGVGPVAFYVSSLLYQLSTPDDAVRTTIAALNPGGEDVVGSFDALDGDGTVLVFAGLDGNGEQQNFSSLFINGFTDSVAVTEPSLLSALTGVLLVGLVLRRRVRD